MKSRIPVPAVPFAAQPDLDDPESWPEVDICDAGAHADGVTGPRYATHRLHLPTGPTDYCWPCHEWALKVYRDTLSCHVHVEELPACAVIKQILDAHGRISASVATERNDVDT